MTKLNYMIHLLEENKDEFPDDWVGNVLRINSNNDKAYYHRGIAKGNVDDMKGACSDWKKSASLGNKSALEFVNNDC